jgi:hypothetical protein
VKRLAAFILASILLIFLVLPSSCGISNGKTKEIRGVPSFSEDGVIMIYLTQESTTLNLYDWKTGEEEQFTFSRPIYNPQISPDSSRLFYTQLSEAGYFSELWTLDLATGEERRLTDEEYGDIYSYTVSPGGSYLAFFAFHDNWNLQSLFLMSTASSEIHFIGGEMPEISIDDLVQPVFTAGESRVLFALGNSIYVVNMSDYQLERVIDVGKRVHYLSALSDHGVFIALQDGYYQVFSLNLQTETINQLTFGKSNKLLPFIAEDGYLYYIDAGEKLDPRQLSYMVWLTSRNSTSVFKDYRNDWGRLSWGESYTLEFLITAYEAFNDGYFLEEFANHAGSVIESMDVKLGVKDYSGLSTYGWSTTRYSIDKRSRMRSVVTDAMIGVPLADFIKLTKDKALIDSKAAKVAQDSLDALRYIVQLHDEEWVEHEEDNLAITEEGEGYYIFPKGSPTSFDGINLPFNQQNRFGTLLIQLYEIDGEPRYLDMALKLGKVFHQHLTPDNEGYKWYYWWGKATGGWDESEGISTNTPEYDGHKGYDGIGYATMEVEFATNLAQYGVFDNEDMEKLVNTYLDPDSRILFHRSKVGALLSDYSQTVVAEMGEIEILAEQWKYIPYLGLAREDDNDVSWQLKRMDIAATGEPETLFSGNDLIYFIETGAGIAIVIKNQDQPYTINFLAPVESGPTTAAPP